MASDTSTLQKTQRPRQNPAFQIREQFSPAVTRVWDLCDGLTPVAEIAELSPLSEATTHDVLAKLRSSGALLLPGERPEEVKELTDVWDATWSKDAAGRFQIVGDPIGERALSEPAAPGPAAAPEPPAAPEPDVEPLLELDIDTKAPPALEPIPKPAAREPSKPLALPSLSKPKRPASRSDVDPRSTRKPEPEPERERDQATYLYMQACEREAQQEYSEALVLFQAMVEADNHYGPYLRRATRCAFRARKLSIAAKWAKLVVKIEPKDADAHHLLAKVLMRQNRFEQAAKSLRRALELAPPDEGVRKEMSRELLEMERRLDR